MYSKLQDQHERNVKADVILWTCWFIDYFWRYGLFFCRCVNKATKPRKHVLQYIEMNPCFKIQLGRSNFYNGKILKNGPTIGDVLFTHFVLTIFKLLYCVCTCFMIGPLRVFLSLHLFEAHCTFFFSFFFFLDELLTFTGVKTDNFLNLPRTMGPSHKGSGSVPDATSQSDWIVCKSVCDVKSRKGPCPFCLDHQPFLEACKRMRHLVKTKK